LTEAQSSLPAVTRRGAVFFDRDGVLNRDTGYVHRYAALEWLPGVFEAVKRVNDAGFYAFVVTNQSGVARGYYGEEEVRALHAAMQAELRRRGARIDAWAYCPHHPEGVGAYRRSCDRRKPGPGMLRDLMAAWPVDLGRSVMIGDKPSDLEAARAAGVRGVLASGDLDALVADLLPRLGTIDA